MLRRQLWQALLAKVRKTCLKVACHSLHVCVSTCLSCDHIHEVLIAYSIYLLNLSAQYQRVHTVWRKSLCPRLLSYMYILFTGLSQWYTDWFHWVLVWRRLGASNEFYTCWFRHSAIIQSFWVLIGRRRRWLNPVAALIGRQPPPINMRVFFDNKQNWDTNRTEWRYWRTKAGAEQQSRRKGSYGHQDVGVVNSLHSVSVVG